MTHSFVTIAVPFDALRADAVEKHLGGPDDPRRKQIADLLDAAEFVHFMSISVIPGEKRARLVIEATADGPVAAALARLEAVLGAELQALLKAAGFADETKWRDVLRRHRLDVGNGWFSKNPGLNFDGTPRLSVGRIIREAAMARRISRILDGAPRFVAARDTLEYVRAEVWKGGSAKWAFAAETAPFLEGVPSAQPVSVRPVLSAIAQFLWPHLLAAAVVGGLTWCFTSLGWAVAASALTLAATPRFGGAAALARFLWLPLIAAALSGGLAWYVAGFGWAVAASALALAVTLCVGSAAAPRDGIVSAVWSATTTFLWPPLVVAALAGVLTWCFAGFGWGVTAGGLALAAAFALVISGYRRFRRKEATDIPDDSAPQAADVQAMMERESHTAQNLLAAASTVKPGFIRRISLRLGLWAATMAALYFSRPGFLTDIGVIHFARWFRLPGTDKLMFFSNYDGALESYLEDFIERGSRGVTGIWSNTAGFPKTRNLLNDGAKDGDRLRRFVRRQMFPPLFWYSAYPDRTLNRIRTNAAIRQGLASANTEAEAADWLACFGSAPRPAAAIEESEVPTLVFGGLSQLPFGMAIFLRLAPDTARPWLRTVEGSVSFGPIRDKRPAFVVGLAQSALGKLGVKRDHLATFPVPFLQDNYAEWRARAVGDTGNNAPEHWWWGAPHKSVDAVVVIYADDAQALRKHADKQIEEIGRFGHTIVQQVQFKQLPAKGSKPEEPFGFRDGISQPLIRGTPRAAAAEEQHQLVSPGEFILGYPDNLGYFPPTPTVPAEDDPGNILPALACIDGQRPNFARPLPAGPRDLGRNGTFLVVRQLEQNVDGFKKFISDTAAALAQDRREAALAQEQPEPVQVQAELEEWLGAKLVGRWKNGTSLVRNPQCPGPSKGRGSFDNDFLFGPEDATGWRCPFGAHIRRANPRDSFEPGSKEQLSITNRHRILRVGRSYEPQNGWERPGLVFMCLNVDIERQFEFVQQTWLLGSSFNGLENESDPILNTRKGDGVFTIPTPRGPLRIKGMSDFVTVRGAGYFFLPSRRALRFLAR